MAAGCSRDGDQVTDRRQPGFPDPGDIEQVLDRLERAVCLAMGDDLAGDDRTNAWQALEIDGGGGVQGEACAGDGAWLGRAPVGVLRARLPGLALRWRGP